MENYAQQPQNDSFGNGLKWGCGCAVAGSVVAGIVVAAVAAFIWWGIGLLETQIGADLRTNPVIQEHLGEVQSCDLNWVASGELPEDVYSLTISGSKGNGVVECKTETVSPEEERVLEGTLTMSDGKTFDLFPDGAPEAAAPAEVDLEAVPSATE